VTENTESLLGERLEIETPERVKIVHDLAGIGSRFAAGSIDFTLLAFAFAVLGGAYVIIERVTLPKGEEAQQAFAMACIGGFSVVLAGYYIGFEWMWAGQTPGKRALKLRVMSDSGGPASTGAIFVRNILRVVDILPGIACYGLGGLVMFVNRRAKRIGDYAAGTIVVRERAEPLAVRSRTPSTDALHELPGESFAAADLARVQSFVSRAAQFIPASRAALARQIAEDVAKRHQLACGDPEQFLRLVAQGRTPQSFRDAEGPRT
jgi:uncharacterized RDD family membrane protein YckC